MNGSLAGVSSNRFPRFNSRITLFSTYAKSIVARSNRRFGDLSMQCLFKWSVIVMVLSAPIPAIAEGRPRARDIGVPFDGVPGTNNAITDVAGLEVEHATLIVGEGKLRVGKRPVRTGVTAVLPRGRDSSDPVFAGWFSLNGNGEMTGTTWIEESGFLEGPVLITNTTSVGTVRDAAIKWRLNHHSQSQPWLLPVVAETYDGYLNDTHGFHIREHHVFAALDSASAGA